MNQTVDVDQQLWPEKANGLVQSRQRFPKTLYVPYPVQGHEETRASDILLSRRRWHVGDRMGKTEAAQHESTGGEGNGVF